MSATLQLPRNTTRQAEGYVTGRVARSLNRWSGMIIVAFVLVHVMAEAIRHLPALATANAAMPWLPVLQNQPWIHALLYAAIVFHTLYGLKLLAGDLGVRLPYRESLWIIIAVASVTALRELLRYAGL